MEILEQFAPALDELAKFSCLRHDQTFMPQPLPLIMSLKRWREQNGFSQEVFIEALARLPARWTLTRSQAPEMETSNTLCKTRAYVLLNNTPKLGDVTAQRNEELTSAEKEGE